MNENIEISAPLVKKKKQTGKFIRLQLAQRFSLLHASLSFDMQCNQA